MHNIVILIPKHLTPEQRKKLSNILVRIATAHIAPIIIAQTPAEPLTVMAQNLQHEFKKHEIKRPDIKTPEQILIKKKTKEQNQRKIYIQNQINKTYLNQRKIYFNRTKHK